MFLKFSHLVQRHIVLPFFVFCGFFVVQDKKIVILGSQHGYYFADNAAHLYRWLRNHSDYFRPVWITRCRKVYQDLRDEGCHVYLAWSIQAIWFLLRAKTLCFTHSFRDVALSPYMISAGRYSIFYLTHDIAPKRSRHARVGQVLGYETQKRSERERKLVTHYISTSPFISECRAQALAVSPEKFVVTGLPRNDVLMSAPKRRRMPAKSLKLLSGGQKIILYAPTWRSGREPTEIMPFDDLDFSHFSNFLEERDALFLLRCHKNDMAYPKVLERIKNLKSVSCRILDATYMQFDDINEMLLDVDVLVSDYSGIIHDFLLLDRPCVFVPYDFQRFADANGFFYDYKKYMPGRFACTYRHFISALEDALEGVDHYKEKRKILRELIFSYQDNHSCERVHKIMLENTQV